MMEKPLLKIKSLFFDKAGVINKVDAATRKVLSKFGAFVRTTAKHSIRKKKGPSAPGTPPNSHVGLLKKFIFFSYEPEHRNVVIGPTLLSSKKSGGSNTVPGVLEYGGKTQRVVWDDTEKKRKNKNVTIQSRPFMHPAFDRELPKLPAMWKNSVK
jgi:hypothetical protein